MSMTGRLFFAVYLIDEEHKWLNGAAVVEQNLPAFPAHCGDQPTSISQNAHAQEVLIT
jgi:hypothetical protein